MSYQLAKAFLYFWMPRYRDLFAAVWIRVNVVSTPVPFKITSSGDQFSDEMAPFQAISKAIFLVFAAEGIEV
jgi:hypothetical protein